MFNFLKKDKSEVTYLINKIEELQKELKRYKVIAGSNMPEFVEASDLENRILRLTYNINGELHENMLMTAKNGELLTSIVSLVSGKHDGAYWEKLADKGDWSLIRGLRGEIHVAWHNKKANTPYPISFSSTDDASIKKIKK